MLLALREYFQYLTRERNIEQDMKARISPCSKQLCVLNGKTTQTVHEVQKTNLFDNWADTNPSSPSSEELHGPRLDIENADVFHRQLEREDLKLRRKENEKG